MWEGTFWATKRVLTLSLVVVFLLSISSVPSAYGQATQNQWPTYQGNNQHTGLSPYNTSENTGGLKCSLDLTDQIESSPVISLDGTIYLATSENLYAIYPNGSIKWTIDNIGGYCTPSLDSSGNIYHSDGKLYSFAPDGTERWNFSSNGSMLSPVVEPSGIVYACSDDGMFYAINSDGSERWNTTLSGHSNFHSPAVASDGTVYYATANSGTLYAIEPSGNVKWNYSTGNSDRSTSIDNQGRIIVASLDDIIYCINTDGSLAWETTMPDSIRTSPGIGSDGTIYIPLMRHQLVALNPNGNYLWTSERVTATSSVGVNTSPAISSDGSIYFHANDARLYAFDDKGEFQWYFTPPFLDNTYQAELSSPAIGADGTVYYGGSDGYLYAVWGQNEPPVATFSAFYPLDNSTRLIHFDASGSTDAEDAFDNLTFRWDFGDNSTGYGHFLNHTYESYGNYSVILTVTDSTGKQDSMTVNITLLDGEDITPPPPIITEKSYVYLFLFALINVLPLATIILRSRRLKDVEALPNDSRVNIWLKVRTTPIIWLTVLMIADVITTYIAISQGLGYESNPLAQGMLEMNNGYYIILGLKLLVISLVTYVAYRIYKIQQQKEEYKAKKFNSEVWVWVFTIGVMIITVGNNILIISP